MSARAESEHQQFNVGVKALIVKNGRVLLLRRRDHDVWEFPGGRINKGEDICQTLLRELAEELPAAKRSTVRGIVHAQQTDFELPNGNRLMLLFFQVKTALPDTFVVSDEHEQACWASASELRQLAMQPSFRHAALTALARP